MRGNSLQTSWGRVRLDVKERFFMERFGKHWKGQPQAVVECVDVAFEGMGWWGPWLDLMT